MSTAPTTIDDRTRLRPGDDDSAAVARAVATAVAASERLARMPRADRARLLERIADGLEERRPDIVRTADEETALGAGRLNGELTRTVYQLRFFADVVRDGAHLEAIIDHEGDTPMGPRPDLRRMLVPLGPVAVYAASNFPLAFSVAGGDTAAALAAGCAVVVKAHPAHRRTSELVHSVLTATAEDAVGLVHGFEAGLDLVRAPEIRAASFTGSLAGGRALADLAAARPAPIPFYGELGSVNPMLVTPAAAQARAESIGEGLAASVALGGGQFCTKPGVVLVPAGPAGDALVDRLRDSLAAVEPHPALTPGMAASYAEGVRERASERGAELLLRTPAPEGSTGPALLEVPGGDLPPLLREECFGPVAVVSRYRDDAHAAAIARTLPGTLTASLFVADGDDGVPLARAALSASAGRILYNGFPTGVAVAWAQNHGGPWPSTDSTHTSVGATSVRRFLRPVAWQNAPTSELPVELRDGESDIPRRVDGVLVLGTRAAVPASRT
ncbi:aldehyde dehydrogenase (NADP(+)) [Rathayibacter caricis DSM 15933]|uniref:Aldehyde dehydrogenase (NADP(+)) n=1 Tax=Rathayibacter caricis DSM 15933 TaxID=1328867 RepID=A0A2T4UT70_9MICO|nr:aldehyde dehydrogenase family protein [Rathayibacter caricis]PTL72705.1 aldehyde dehydrogenase (NADP(+)) [Rathayibacter caricis DSM 15933]